MRILTEAVVEGARGWERGTGPSVRFNLHEIEERGKKRKLGCESGKARAERRRRRRREEQDKEEEEKTKREEEEGAEHLMHTPTRAQFQKPRIPPATALGSDAVSLGGRGWGVSVYVDPPSSPETGLSCGPPPSLSPPHFSSALHAHSLTHSH